MATEKKKRLVTPEGIACFVHVFEPHAQKREDGTKGDPKYSVLLVFPSKEAIKELRRECMAAATAKFGEEKWRALLKKGKFRFPWRPATDYDEYGPPFDDENAVFCIFSSKDQPDVVDRRAKPVMKQKEIYSGMKARVSYGVWPYDTNGNKGVTLFLNNLQKTDDGEKLAGRSSGEDDFEPVEGEDGSDDDEDDGDI